FQRAVSPMCNVPKIECASIRPAYDGTTITSIRWMLNRNNVSEEYRMGALVALITSVASMRNAITPIADASRATILLPLQCYTPIVTKMVDASRMRSVPSFQGLGVG